MKSLDNKTFFNNKTFFRSFAVASSSLGLLLLLLLLSLLSTTTSSSSSSFILAATGTNSRYGGDSELWSNLTLSPHVFSGISGDVTFLFVPSDNRGAGTVLYTHQQGGAIYGASIDGYKYGSNSPKDAGTNKVGVQLTEGSDTFGSPICPSWYTPPATYDAVIESLSNPLNNQTVFTPDFRLLGHSLQLDHRDRLVVHSGPLQILVRLDATANQLQSTINTAVTPPSQVMQGTVYGNFIVSLLWGAWCNGTNLPFTNRNYNPVNTPPDSGVMTLVRFLETYNVGEPSFLPDDGLIFRAHNFHCVFYAGPSTNWMVVWWIGNCSITDNTNSDTPVPSYATPTTQQDAECGRVDFLYVQTRTAKVYIVDRHAIREIDLVTDMVRLVAGNTTNFVMNPQNCDMTTSCSAFNQQLFVRNMVVVPNVASQVDGEATTMLFFTDQLFQVLYSVDIRHQLLFTELVNIVDNGNSLNRTLDCIPTQVAASRIDLYVVCSGKDGRVMRKKMSPPDPPVEPVVALPQLDEATLSTVTALTTLTGLIGVPTVAVTAGRIRALVGLARCDVNMERGVPLDWTESPTQLSIGDSDYRYYTGTVVGNLAIIIIVPFLVHFIMVRVLLWHNMRKKKTARKKEMMDAIVKHQNTKSPDGIDLTPFLAQDATNLVHNDAATVERMKLEAEVTLRYPSASLFFAIMFTLEPTVRSAAFLMRFADPSHPDNFKTAEANPANRETTADFAIGIVGVIITSAFIIGIAYFFGYTFTAVFYPKDDPFEKLLLGNLSFRSLNSQNNNNNSSFGSKKAVEYQQEYSASQILRLENVGCMVKMRMIARLWYGAWKEFSKPYGEWRDHRNEQPQRFGALVKPYVDRGRWWVVMELLSAAVLGALAGFKTRESCVIIASIAVPILWGFFVGVIVIRPMASPFDNLLQSMIAGLSAFSSLCLLAAAVPFNNHQDFIQSAFSLAETLALAAAFLVGIDALLDIGNRFFKLLKFLIARWCPDDEDDQVKIANNNGQNSNSTGNNTGTGTGTGSTSFPNISFDITPNSQDTNRTSSSPMVIDSLNADATRQSSGSSGNNNRRSNSITTPINEGVLVGTPGDFSSSSGGGRTASSDMDLFEAVQKQIAKSSRKQQKQIMSNRKKMILAAASSSGAGAPPTPTSNGSNPHFLLPPNGMTRSSSTGSSSSLATMIRQSSTSTSTGRSSDSSFIRNYMNNNTGGSPAEKNNTGTRDSGAPTSINSQTTITKYELDDDEPDMTNAGARADSIEVGGFSPREGSSEPEESRRRRELLEYEILRAKLKHELDTGEDASGLSPNNDDNENNNGDAGGSGMEI